ncbi:SDR family NAD(P)-dependent oxidoreductase [Agromyces bauzanensis]
MALPDLWNLDGRIAIVSGAGSPAGIGFAAARALGELGAGIVLTATSERVHERAEELRRSGITATGLVARLDVEDEVDDLAAELVATGIRPNIVVNNAGMIATGDPEMLRGDATMSMADWNASLAMNLTTAFLLTRAMLPGMRQAGWGRVICVSSLSGPVMASRGDVGYATAKAGMLGYVRALAVDESLAGITANAVAPGWIATTSQLASEAEEGLLVPVGRSGRPEEVASAIAWLATPGAAYTTGQLLVVDGGNAVAEERR